jgi:hypothetical protein
MNTPTLTKNYTAEAAVTKYRIVKRGATDGSVLQGAAVTDKLMGVCAELDLAITERGDIHVAGVALVEYGGTVTRGDPLTSDASGKAVVAAPAAGANNRLIGFAEVSGVSGDIGSVQIAPGFMQG